MIRAAQAQTRGNARDFRQVGDGQYQLGVLSLGIQLTVDRLRRERHELIGELAVACDLAGAKTVDGYLTVADFNLSSAQARVTRARLLAERSGASDIDWHGLVEELCVRVITAERHGTPARLLSTFTAPGPNVAYDVNGWPWLRDHMTILFADGGGLKSYLALYGAAWLARQGVRVLYVDWELTGDDHLEREHRLFGAPMPDVHYLRCDRPLTEEVDRITREVRRLSIDFWIGDSVGFGTAGPPEAAEHALAYCRAVRLIGLGSLQLAHINRSENGDQKPFGSSFWHNSARSTWFAKQATATTDGQRLTLGLFHRKSNVTRKSPAIGFQFDFDETRTALTRVDVADNEDLAVQLPTWQRIANVLRSGPRTLTELEAELELKPETLRKAVSPKRGRSMFTKVVGADGEARIALVERWAG